jgi:hypothetical protein
MKLEEDLDIHEQELLLTAYMNLFDALTAKFQACKKSLGMSWSNALCEIRKIVIDFRKNNPNKSTKYLQRLYNSHNDATFQKMMIPENIVKIDIPNKPMETLLLNVQTAHNELQRAIESIEKKQIVATIIPTACEHQNKFTRWGKKLPSYKPLGIDIAAFERSYSKYVAKNRNNQL